MPVIIDGTSGVATPNTFAFKNRLIDAGYIINQRGYTSGTSLSSGSYGHDRWRGGAGAGTYTFTQGSAGVPIVITVTAGTIQQVIEGCNVPEGGTYTLSWTGTATARINSGSYASSPITVTSQTAGANMTIEFATGTVSFPQLESGAQATSFDYRSFGDELALCQRYYAKMISSTAIASFGSGYVNGSTQALYYIKYPTTMRASPTFSYSSLAIDSQPAAPAVTSAGTTYAGTDTLSIVLNASGGGLTAGQATTLRGTTTTAFVAFSAEL